MKRKSGIGYLAAAALEGADNGHTVAADYAEFGPAFEISFAAIFADAEKYRGVIAATNGNLKPEDVAQKQGLNGALLKRWIDLAAVRSAAPIPRFWPIRSSPLARRCRRSPLARRRPASSPSR